MKKTIIHVSFTMLLALLFQGNSAWAQPRPNFIIVITDDQGYGDVGYMGNDQVITPNLDEMAKESLQLRRCYSAPVCSPTRASVLTGRYPTRTGVFSWGHVLRPQERSVASILKESGYQTGFFGKWHLGSLRSEEPTSPGARGFETWYAAANYFDNDPWMSRNGKPVQLKGESSEVTVEKALEYIGEARRKDAPFLVFIWLGSPHLPHQAADSLKKLYPGQPESMQNYLGEITGIDLAVGKLRKRLEESGLADETLVWFSSDNGGKLPQANNLHLREEKGTLYEGGIRIPALIEWPGHIRPGISRTVTGTVDLFPTLLELAGIDPSEISYPLDGISLTPLFDGKTTARDKPLGFWSYPDIKGHPMKSDQIVQDYAKVLNGEMDVSLLNEGLLNPPDKEYTGLDSYPYSGTCAWIDNEWKLYQKGTESELYNLKTDESEKRNVAGQYPDRVARMKEALLAWQQSVIKSIRGEDY